MKKFLKLFVVIVTFSILFISNVNATGIIMNLENQTDFSNNNIQNETENEFVNNVLNEQENITEPEVEDENDSPRVTSSKATSDDEFLTTENILSIILIVIGVLLIFLGVAILIKFK